MNKTIQVIKMELDLMKKAQSEGTLKIKKNGEF